LKNDKLEWVVQKATELGVGRIILMKTKHCVKQDASESFIQRLRKIAQEAAEQSEGAQIPIIDTPQSFNHVIDTAQSLGKVHLLNERGGEAFAGISKGVFLVGPEGGFDESEFLYATSKGVTMVSLGKRILRAETAALAVLAKVLL
ncbi:RNA methyltransferase, partial [Candidatus Falkowbacteria bacterium]|nr:RNA methyltransferase [Candidatus Falkowbacteria bacterium]